MSKKERHISKMKSKMKLPNLFDNLDMLASVANHKQDSSAENPSKAFELFEKGQWWEGLRFAEKTNMKNAKLWYYMGRFYDEGYAVERDLECAVEWYKEAASKGNVKARKRCEELLAYLSNRFWDSCPGYEGAEYVFRKRCREAAERGDGEAMVRWAYLNTIDGDDSECAMWLARAESQKNGRVLYLLGRVFEMRSDEENDQKVALSYFRDAAELGSYDAMLKLKHKFKEDCELVNPPKDEIEQDYILGDDGIYHRRIKTGPWMPIKAVWMTVVLWKAVCNMHRISNSLSAKGLHDASLGERIFGIDGPEHEGYGTGELQKWADKMVKEGKNPYEVNLLKWFDGAADAFHYHCARRTFENMMEEQRPNPDSPMRYVIEKMQRFIPQDESLSREQVEDMMRELYYTVLYAPYGSVSMRIFDS